jgi:ElaB/YqjD/DUF883 family membrane-anchored ribosome-binding protein
MDQEPETIKQDIEQTASSLKDKVEMLEEKVVGTVKGTTEAVSDTVENVKESVAETIETVKETVSETVQSVKQAFDVCYQTRQHPWLMMCGSMAAGFAVGKLLGPRRSESARSDALPTSSATAYQAAPTRQTAYASAPSTNGIRPGLLSRFFGKFEPEINQVKEMAIGTMFGFLRDLAKQALPERLSAKVDDVMNRVTTKLGGEPIHGPVMQQAGMAR